MWMLIGAVACAALAAWKMLQFHGRLAALENERWEQTLAALNIYQRPIVLFGDSQISRWPVATSFGQLPVLNRGVAGDLATEAQQRFEQQVVAMRPAAVVILIGTNDIGHGKSVDEVLGTIRQMVQMARATGAAVMLCSVLPARGEAARIRPSIRPVNEGLRELARREGAVYVDLYSAVLNQRGEFADDYSDDGLHPNGAGYVRMTHVLLPYVLQSISRPVAPQSTATEGRSSGVPLEGGHLHDPGATGDGGGRGVAAGGADGTVLGDVAVR
jgi:lysophospholipase L1-like esterase